MWRRKFTFSSIFPHESPSYWYPHRFQLEYQPPYAGPISFINRPCHLSTLLYYSIFKLHCKVAKGTQRYHSEKWVEHNGSEFWDWEKSKVVKGTQRYHSEKWVGHNGSEFWDWEKGHKDIIQKSESDTKETRPSLCHVFIVAQHTVIVHIEALYRPWVNDMIDNLVWIKAYLFQRNIIMWCTDGLQG